jgi:hypothetical protein
MEVAEDVVFVAVAVAAVAAVDTVAAVADVVVVPEVGFGVALVVASVVSLPP